MLLEANPSRFVVHPHSAIVLEHAMQFVEHIDEMFLILVLIHVVAAFVVVDALVPATVRLDCGDFEKASHRALEATLRGMHASTQDNTQSHKEGNNKCE